ncbi:MAG: class I SAM-dependent methyltransferase [Methanospirillum sp.]|uniref:class I SAM-dependent methyltransferase n=1 Tax=Methanospirillum sp. TaxID=45200 RepID=UPI00236F6DFF|nr:class I SAM-dependent methyltransferase [Methanospirillum sp.]MDD1729231.1 class I SAM-dependent methyltransferase [Methanospirillum sp.]
MEHVRKAFDAFAQEYDRQREYVIPDMQQFYYTAVWAADSPRLPPKILDIGAGTGLLSAFLLQKYPDGAITLMDFSEQMLNVARQRFTDRNNITYVVSDYTGPLPDGPYDIVCSALSIHHLGPDQKRQLFSKIFHSLTPGGMFVNADQADGETRYFRERYLTYWNEFLRAGRLGEQEREKILTRRDQLDKNKKLSLQLAWLSDAGFSDVDIVYKNRTFIVTVAVKRTG